MTRASDVAGHRQILTTDDCCYVLGVRNGDRRHGRTDVWIKGMGLGCDGFLC